MTTDSHHVDVLIIGAGISGIGCAWHLQKSCPDQSYAILEARDALGGTWDLFRYPGIRSDSDMYTFGFAFRPWTAGEAFADGPSIREYVRSTARDNRIDGRIRYGHRMTQASFDSASARWTVHADTADGPATYTARFLVNCSGYYNYARGHEPEFEGASDFRGPIVHPQKWTEDIDVAGKRVVIIGSGATAVTMVPALAEKAAHVTMLQRSPTYIAAQPGRDAVAEFLKEVLPPGLAHRVARMKNVLRAIFFYELSQRYPEFVRRGVLKAAQEVLGPDFDVERHFSPAYKPWDQRFCLAPDGDFFQALAGGDASIVTDTIQRFTPDGILLSSGTEIEADVIVTATGLRMLLFGGASLTVDGQVVTPRDTCTYRGMMLSGVPNFAVAFGYTNASWTLKVDLTAERICRTLNHMQANGYDTCTPVPPADLETAPMLDFSSGYVQRALAHLPKQGTKPPWRTYQNYIKDMITIRYGRIEDGHMQFRRNGSSTA
ncbi:MAG: NAD(P)/FAD-dependent oxidoreductase [Rhodothermales bacterium]|nr:NAD(P)/FAD-dependent oxidoreductase [Rhodothermales bacterium]